MRFIANGWRVICEKGCVERLEFSNQTEICVIRYATVLCVQEHSIEYFISLSDRHGENGIQTQCLALGLFIICDLHLWNAFTSVRVHLDHSKKSGAWGTPALIHLHSQTGESNLIPFVDNCSRMLAQKYNVLLQIVNPK